MSRCPSWGLLHFQNYITPIFSWTNSSFCSSKIWFGGCTLWPFSTSQGPNGSEEGLKICTGAVQDVVSNYFNVHCHAELQNAAYTILDIMANQLISAPSNQNTTAILKMYPRMRLKHLFTFLVSTHLNEIELSRMRARRFIIQFKSAVHHRHIVDCSRVLER